MADTDQTLKALEFYSGIGGMHYALKQQQLKKKKIEVVGAFDINTTANIVYKHNFPHTHLHQKNIQGLSVEYLSKLNADIWTMSPPCQPYTRQGKQEASSDTRAQSFLNILNILREMPNPPQYIFLENVKGFECSDTRDMLIETLRAREYNLQEFLLSPTEFKIPNSRTRYYLVAKRGDFSFVPSGTLIEDIESYECTSSCGCNNNGVATGETTGVCAVAKLKKVCAQCPRRNLSDFMEKESSSLVNSDEHFLNDNVLLRYHSILDIKHTDSTRSCCFTKAYSKYVEGTGSVFTSRTKEEVEKIYDQVSDTDDEQVKSNLLKSLGLRYFTPREVSNLMCFPASSQDFEFPEETTCKQKYRLLGNSVNVFVIATLMKTFLFSR